MVKIIKPISATYRPALAGVFFTLFSIFLFSNAALAEPYHISTSADPAANAYLTATFSIQLNTSVGPTNISQAIFMWDNVNYTKLSTPAVTNNTAGVFTITMSGQPAGTHNYTWYYNDTLNTWNLTSSVDYAMIDKVANAGNVISDIGVYGLVICIALTVFMSLIKKSFGAVMVDGEKKVNFIILIGVILSIFFVVLAIL